MSFRLDSSNLRRSPTITIIGCGGTGGFVAEGLCRLLKDVPQSKLLLIDHDRVEVSNLGRQNFNNDELGMFKAEALALRLSREHKRPLGYSLQAFSLEFNRSLYSELVISAVDNAPAREAIASAVSPSQWWLDAGNGDDWGQVLIGNGRRCERAFDLRTGLVGALPLPTIQRPELIVGAPPVDISCEEGVEAGTQSPTINQAMATVVLEYVRRLLAQTCTWMQVYVNLREPSLYAVEPTPELISKILGVPVRRLVYKER